jgi:hypothetical protein
VSRSMCWSLAVLLVAASARASDAPADSAATTAAPVVPVISVARVETGRPSGLLAAYVAQAALQSYDVYSTLQATRGGAAEQNPVVGGLLAHPTAFVAVKTAVAATTILTAEQLWKRGYRKRAVVLMLASNGLMAVVAANNAAVLRR